MGGIAVVSAFVLAIQPPSTLPVSARHADHPLLLRGRNACHTRDAAASAGTAPQLRGRDARLSPSSWVTQPHRCMLKPPHAEAATYPLRSVIGSDLKHPSRCCGLVLVVVLVAVVVRCAQMYREKRDEVDDNDVNTKKSPQPPRLLQSCAPPAALRRRPARRLARATHC
jgi:hypothetical protein